VEKCIQSFGEEMHTKFLWRNAYKVLVEKCIQSFGGEILHYGMYGVDGKITSKTGFKKKRDDRKRTGLLFRTGTLGGLL